MSSPFTSQTPSQLPPPPARLDPDRWALFLDLDGTLVDLAARPELVAVPEDLPRVLRSVAQRHSGALAILSGRSRADLWAHFGLRGLAAAMLHGLERIDAEGKLRRSADHRLLDAARRQLGSRSRDFPGLWVEDKGGAIALHYRQNPALGPAITELGQELVRGRADLCLQPGVFVIEIKPTAADKGRALSAFLAEAPFNGRSPVMLGDDLTDEHAFAAAAAHGGFGVIVGCRRPTCARFALDRPSSAIDWLHALQDPSHAEDRR